MSWRAMPEPLSALSRPHLERVRAFYEEAPVESRSAGREYRRLLAHYYNRLIPPGASVLEVGCGSGELLAQLQAGRRVGVDLSERRIAAARARMPEAEFFVQAGEELSVEGTFDCIVVSDTLNSAADVQRLLERLRAVSHGGTRLLLNFHSNLWRPVFAAARGLGLTADEPNRNWLSSSDVLNLLDLAGWEPIHRQGRILLPVRIPLLGPLCNRWLAPLMPWAGLTVFLVARPARAPVALPAGGPSVTVVIPARNEAGNIEAAVARTPEMGAGTELIFIEGNSTDHTWVEIERVAAANPHRRIRTMRQTGKGKGNAVREAFAVAAGDILMVLDADLTMPPEELPKFYAVVASGAADFANGVRLVYPMDEKAMQFLNLCANKSFGLIFTWLLGQPVKDTLCGTKVLTRDNYRRIEAGRAYFGDFDPFGDFDLLFGAAKLNLKIADVPIRYRERTYGTTNIHRWAHGWLLLRMILFAMRKIKFV